MEIRFTRKDYMDGNCSHEEYYEQFVRRDTCNLVIAGIGKRTILESKDEAFNDISLAKWDRLANLMLSGFAELAKANSAVYGDGKSYISHSDKVCLLKACARRIKADPDSFV